ncbi:MAG: hypothetical protein NC933_01170 [Candidatus Omnitrophica bacterium]|nr:hypothetical protein [Candidatus Omnitrophota bacterium]
MTPRIIGLSESYKPLTPSSGISRNINKIELIAAVAAGIRLSDIKRDVITIGSKAQAICQPAAAATKRAARSRNFGFIRILFALSDRIHLFRLRLEAISIDVPRGQTQPQKNLPNANVMHNIPTKATIPEGTLRSLIAVITIRSGSNLKSMSGRKAPVSWYVIGHSMQIKSDRKKPCDILRKITNFFKHYLSL